MYITIKSIKKNLGKYIELTDILIGIPMLLIFLILFSFTDLKKVALVFMTICIFMMIPVQLSKKNRMYKALLLLFKYLIKIKEYSYFK